MPHFMIILLLYVNLLNLSWIKNVSEEYAAFKAKQCKKLTQKKCANCNSQPDVVSRKRVKSAK